MSALNVDVRECTAADLELLTTREVSAGSGLAAGHLDLAQAGDYHFVGAFTGDDVAGYVVLDHRPQTELRPEMKDLWVYPRYRRQGVGEALTRAIEDIAKAEGFTEVKLAVDPENPAAIPLYIGLEYTPTGDHRTQTGADGATTRAAVYRKSLTIR